MAVTNRDELIDYCLESLGEPVVKVNCAEVQIENCINDTIELFHESHYDGSIRTFLSHEVTQADIDNGYISPVPDEILTIHNVFPINDQSSAGIEDPFSARYQLTIGELYGFTQSGGLQQYSMTTDYIEFLQDQLVGLNRIRWNVHERKLFLDVDWAEDLDVGDYLTFDATRIIDPADLPKVYGNRWVKQYATALIQRQWGRNLSKFDQMALPGGATLNGDAILQEAKEMIEKLDLELQEKYSWPLSDFWVG